MYYMMNVGNLIPVSKLKPKPISRKTTGGST